MQQFKPGDVVKLKSGSPKMTVDRVLEFDGTIMVEYLWFVDTTQHKGICSPEALELAPSEDKPAGPVPSGPHSWMG